MDLCDTTEIITAVIRSVCFDQRPNDRYTIVYSYPYDELDLIIKNAANDSLSVITGESGFLTLNPTLTRDGISFYIGGNEAFLDTSGGPTVITLTYDGLDVPLTESPPGTFTATITEGAYDYEFSYDSGAEVLTIVIKSGTTTVNTITIDETSGAVTVV